MKYIIHNCTDSDRNITGSHYTVAKQPDTLKREKIADFETKSFSGVAKPLDEADHAMTLRMAFLKVIDDAFQNGNLNDLEIEVRVCRSKLEASAAACKCKCGCKT